VGVTVVAGAAAQVAAGGAGIRQPGYSITNDKYIGSGQPRGYGYVEMALKSEGVTAVANLKGKKLRERVINVVEALPLSDKRAMVIPYVKKNNRSNKNRERKYDLI
jgi:RNA recognition motif-containing protein